MPRVICRHCGQVIVKKPPPRATTFDKDVVAMVYRSPYKRSYLAAVCRVPIAYVDRIKLTGSLEKAQRLYGH